MTYREFKIPKKSKGYRKITAPDAELKAYQQSKLPSIERDYHKLIKGTSIQNTAHGFISGRNVITAAEQHIGFAATEMMDLSDFFDTVHVSMLDPWFDDKYFYNSDGYCGQGFCTSPMLSNIAFIPTLQAIKDYLVEEHPDHAFTQYADDLAISTNQELSMPGIVSKITEIVEAHGFWINPKKTRIKYAKFGWRRILGVNVGRYEVRATRKIMRRIRAAQHQKNGSSLGGLRNWSTCKKPKEIK